MTLKNILIYAVSVCVLFGAWAVAARVAATPFILPDPLSVLADCAQLITDSSFANMLGMTCARALFSFLVSLALSALLGFCSGAWPSFAMALKPWMAVIKSTPVVSFILIALLWFGSSIVPIFVAVLMTLPVMTEAIATGVRSSDPKLIEMSRVYRFSARDRIMHIQVPSAMPFFLGGAGASLGLTWKVVVAGEILSVPKFGIGSAMQTAKVHLETSRVFSLTIAAILLSVATEFLFNQLVRFSKRHMIREGGA
jgi:NitT/TauT family transport system permease protein